MKLDPPRTAFGRATLIASLAVVPPERPRPPTPPTPPTPTLRRRRRHPRQRRCAYCRRKPPRRCRRSTSRRSSALRRARTASRHRAGARRTDRLSRRIPRSSSPRRSRSGGTSLRRLRRPGSSLPTRIRTTSRPAAAPETFPSATILRSRAAQRHTACPRRPRLPAGRALPHALASTPLQGGVLHRVVHAESIAGQFAESTHDVECRGGESQTFRHKPPWLTPPIVQQSGPDGSSIGQQGAKAPSGSSPGRASRAAAFASLIWASPVSETSPSLQARSARGRRAAGQGARVRDIGESLCGSVVRRASACGGWP